MDKERFESGKQTIGLWKGFEYIPPPGWRTTPLDGLLLATRERVDPSRDPAVIRLRRQAQSGLLKTRMPQATVRELLAFEGKLPDLLPILNQLQAKFGRDFPDSLRKTLIELRSARMRCLLERFKAGVLGFAPTLAFDHHNKVLNAYLDAVQARMQGTQSANQTLEVQTVEVGAGYPTPAGTDTALQHLLGAGKAPGEIDVVGYQTTWITHFELADNNGAETTIAAVTDTTHITLTSATGFANGDRIEIQTSGGSFKRTITALAGADATLDTAVTGMAITNPVLQIWGESGLKGNNDGTTLFTHSQFSDGGYTKTEHKSILVESAIIERSVGA
jgi:hypothetical protein